MRYFLHLRNRGFKKYLLNNLFSKITYAERNKLLSSEVPFSNICEPVTYQEAERSLLRDGEELFAQSQGDGATYAPPASVLPTLSTLSTLTTQHRDTGVETNRQSREEISLLSGITSHEGWNLACFPSSPCFSY